MKKKNSARKSGPAPVAASRTSGAAQKAAGTAPKSAASEAAAANSSLGARVRRMRQERRWSLSELARRSTIATSTLSKVENGILSLTYDRLLLVAQAFELTLSEFLADSGGPSMARADAVARISWAKKGSGERLDANPYTYRYLCTNLRAKQMVPILSLVKARKLEEFGDLLVHEGEEFVFVVQGRLEVHTQFYEREILEQGEGVYLDSRMGHAYLNAADGETWILSVNTGAIPPEQAAATPARSARTVRR